METIHIYDNKENVAEATTYYKSGKVYSHEICKSENCHVIWYEEDGTINREFDYKPKYWKN